MTNPIMLKDFYKTGHANQYPKGTTVIYSNFTPRGSRLPGIEKVVVFGIQYLIKEYLIKQYNENFFGAPKEKVVAEYQHRMDTSLGEGVVSATRIGQLHDLGYLPIEIKALPEGTRCPMRTPVLTIKNTHPDFFWVTNMLETLLSTVLWGMINSATIADVYKRILTSYAAQTSSTPEFVQFQGHDFSMRGMFGVEAATMSGAAHLLSFSGTDTIPAINFLEGYYNANADTELIGVSVPATEHSVMCFGNPEDEYDTYKRLLTETYPKGIVSVVSDTWDYWGILTGVLPRLKDTIMQRDGKLVIRPDSGDPVDIICGTTIDSGKTSEEKGSIQLLWEEFGGKVNSKGYKELDPHIGLIYGDSITLERCEVICSRLEAKGFASTNVVLGIGSYSYQYNTRDTFGFAMKATYGVVNGMPINIFKKPKTDDGLKNSAKGLLYVNEDLTLAEEVSEEKERNESNALKLVFKDGTLVKGYSLNEIRSKLNDR